MTKVKICGITNLEDALLSAKFGADALGFNFYEKSPRYIAPENVREIIEQLPEDILKVGVFVNESLDKIVQIAETAKLDAIQLHGEETPEFVCELKQKTNLEIIKAFRVSPDFVPEDVLKYETDAILLDAYSPKEHGGTGETFDWRVAKEVKNIFPRIYLAGGINSDNIIWAIRKTEAFAIDVCSSVEKIKGKKDKNKLKKLLNNFSHSKLKARLTVTKEYWWTVDKEKYEYASKSIILGQYHFSPYDYLAILGGEINSINIDEGIRIFPKTEFIIAAEYAPDKTLRLNIGDVSTRSFHRNIDRIVGEFKWLAGKIRFSLNINRRCILELMFELLEESKLEK